MKRYSYLERDAFKAGWQAAALYAERFLIQDGNEPELSQSSRLGWEMSTGPKPWEYAYQEWKEKSE